MQSSLHDLVSDPFQLFDEWLSEAKESGELFHDAMALATADSSGEVRLRTLLFKGRKAQKILFFSNYNSIKAKHFEKNPKASLLFLWKQTYRQVRIDGTVTKMSAEESDQYWSTRPRESQLGALASDQSAPLKSVDELTRRFEALEKDFEQTEEIPRPEHWGGFELDATCIEFWQGRDFRLHERVEYRRADSNRWQAVLLNP